MRQTTEARSGDAVSGDAPIELVPGRLFAVGGLIRADERVSWLPSDASGWQPCYCYLRLANDKAVLIDTGPRILERDIVAQVKQALPAGQPLSIFLTRAEFDCTGNFAAVVDSFVVDSLYTGGANNPFDAFGDMTTLPDWKNRIDIDRTPVGQSVPLDDSGAWRVVAPSIRQIATFWTYDALTRTLFTSDMFGHTTVPSTDSATVIDDVNADTTTREDVRKHLLTKFFWLERAYTKKLQNDLRKIFDDNEVDIVAPSHGAVLKGAPVVRRHLDMVLDCLADFDIAREPR